MPARGATRLPAPAKFAILLFAGRIVPRVVTTSADGFVVAWQPMPRDGGFAVRHYRSTLAALAGAALLSGCAVRTPPPPEPAPVVYEAPVEPGRGLVRAVQFELIRTGYLGGVADGVFGPRTSAAIRRFESANGLPVDGSPSRPLLHRLRVSASTGRGKWVGPRPGPEAPAAAEAPASGWVAPSGPPPEAAPPGPPAANQ